MGWTWPIYNQNGPNERFTNVMNIIKLKLVKVQKKTLKRTQNKKKHPNHIGSRRDIGIFSRFLKNSILCVSWQHIIMVIMEKVDFLPKSWIKTFKLRLKIPNFTKIHFFDFLSCNKKKLCFFQCYKVEKGYFNDYFSHLLQYW